MAQTVLITLTLAGSDTGPFDLYSDVDGYAVPFENNVPKASLTGGYTSVLVPDLATVIRVKSDGLCTNYIDLTITTTTTTSTSSTTSTSTSTTTSFLENSLVVSSRDIGSGLDVELYYSINAGAPVLLGVINSGTCVYMADITGLFVSDVITFTTNTSCVINGAVGYLACPAISGAAIDYTFTITSPGTSLVSISIDSDIIP
jgi:hypothetical protein